MSEYKLVYILSRFFFIQWSNHITRSVMFIATNIEFGKKKKSLLVAWETIFNIFLTSGNSNFLKYLRDLKH